MSAPEGLNLYTTVDDELYDELTELVEQKIVHFELWEESLVEAMSETKAEDATASYFDLDLYLADGVYFELYGTACFPDLENPPLQGLAAVQTRLSELVTQGAWLEEVAVDEEDGLVLVVGQQHKPQLYLVVGGWLLEEWDELPDA